MILLQVLLWIFREIETLNSYDAKYFNMAGEHYLIFSNGSTANYDINNCGTAMFELPLPGDRISARMNMQLFFGEVDPGSSDNDANKSTETKLLKWNGEQFEEVLTLDAQDTVCWEYMEINEKSYLSAVRRYFHGHESWATYPSFCEILLYEITQ